MRKIKTGIPTPPGWLTPEMCKIYDTITRYLQAEKLFDSIDWMLVAMTAKSWVMYEDATKDVLNGDVYQVHSNGAQSFSIASQIMDREEKKLDTYFRRLGIGVESRDRIKLMISKKDETAPQDDMEKMMNAKRRKQAGT